MKNFKWSTPGFVVLVVVASISSSCRNETADTASEDTTDSVFNESTEMPTAIPTPAPALPYTAVFNENTDQLDARPNADFDRDQLTIDTLTQLLMLAYPQIKPEITRVSNDTVYIQIADAGYLTQQMGSSGAAMYLLEATYAYTELPAIQVVHFGFQEGDHAIPGAYTRQDFGEETPL